MRKNNMKLAVAMTLAVFTMMTALVTMQTTAAFAGITQVNTSQAGNKTGNQTGNQTGKRALYHIHTTVSVIVNTCS